MLYTTFVKLVHPNLSYKPEKIFSFFSNSAINLESTDPKYNPKLGFYARLIYTKFRQEKSIKITLLTGKQIF